MSEGILVKTTLDLTKYLISEWERRRKEALELQQKQEKDLNTAIEEEKKLQHPLKAARKIAENLQKEYKRLEILIEKKNRERIEKDSIRAKDVLSGKIKMREFKENGISEKAISDKVISESLAELDDALKACRKKNIEILEMEKALCEAQNLIRNLIVQPGRIILQVFKDCAEIADREIGEFLEEINSSRTALEQVQHKLLLTQGKSLSPGFRWDHLTPSEALDLQFDPIFDLSCIPELKRQVNKFKDVNNISVMFWLRTKSIEVTAIRVGSRGDKAINLSELKDK